MKAITDSDLIPITRSDVMPIGRSEATLAQL